MASTPSLYRVSIVNRGCLPGCPSSAQPWRQRSWWSPSTSAPHRRGFLLLPSRPPAASSRADDSPAPYGMSVETALKLLGVNQGASFDEILRAKTVVAASCKDDPEATAQIEAAYDTLLMQSLVQRRAGKVANSKIRYADVKSVRRTGSGSIPWMQKAMKNIPVSVVTPTNRDLGIQAGVFGTLMVLTFASASSTSLTGPYTGPDVPGYILAIGFGASLYFLAKKNVNLGKATLITVGSLAVGAAVGSTMESLLQVDIVPFFGIRSPAAIISEFILFSELVTSLYLR